MSLRINNNIASLNGQRNMLKNDMAISRSLEKLSSGLRINKAADDAAGLVISEQMRAQIAGINQAIDNSETAISMVQTAEGALDEVNSLLNKARELVLHAANEGANDANQLTADQAELDNVIASISRISDVTQFGTKKLLDGSLNGSSSLSAGIDRVDVGNLANNSAVAAGTVSIVTSGLVIESQALAGITSGADNGYIFGTSGITGVESLQGATVVNSGAVVALTIDGTTYSATSTGAGGETVTAMLGKLNTQLTTNNLNFSASVGTGGGINVSRTTADSTDYTSSITFSRSSGTTAVDANASATLQNVNGSGSNDATASAVFGESSLANVASGSTFLAAGTIVQGQLSYSGGTTNTINYVSTAGATWQDALNALQADVVALGGGLSGSTVSFTATGANLTVAVDSNNVALESMTFSLDIDLPNNNDIDEEVNAFRLDNLAGAGATGLAAEAAIFVASGGSGMAANADVANISLNSGTVMNLDVDGQSFTVSGANGGGTLIATAVTALQGQLDAAFGANVVRVEVSSGASASDTVFGMNMTGGAGSNDLASVATGFNIFIARNNNSTDSLAGATLSFENSLLTGTDITATNVLLNNGSGFKGSSYNLDTTAQTSASGVTANAAGTLGSVSGSTTVTSGTDGVTATLTTANGVSLALVSSGSASTGAGASLVLSSATGNDGYEGIRIGINGATAAASSSNLSFTLEDGAVFQVGANAGQTVGLTIGDIDADELGRDVTGSGVLTSLQDLADMSALTAGLTDEALMIIDAAIDEITIQRGDLGAFQANTLETGLNSLRVSGENLTAAESTIRDVDFAAESARFTRNNIMIQASTAMLAQANQLPQNVLQLLG